MDFGLRNRVALVTGSSRGIGAATARLLGREGARVAVTHSRDERRAERAASEIISSGGEAFVMFYALESADTVAQAVTRISEHWGGVDLLVNNAVAWPTVPPSSAPHSSEPHTATGVDFLLSTQRECSRRSSRCSRGCVTKDGDASSAFRRQPSRMASKAPARIPRQSLRCTVSRGRSHGRWAGTGRHHVTVRHRPPSPYLRIRRTDERCGFTWGVTGSTVLTDLTLERFQGSEQVLATMPDDVLRSRVGASTLGRLLGSDDVARSIVFLASAMNTGITGEAIPVSGGRRGSDRRESWRTALIDRLYIHALKLARVNEAQDEIARVRPVRARGLGLN